MNAARPGNGEEDAGFSGEVTVSRGGVTGGLLVVEGDEADTFSNCASCDGCNGDSDDAEDVGYAGVG